MIDIEETLQKSDLVDNQLNKLVLDSFGDNCVVEKSAQFLSLYVGEKKIALINLFKHRMILSSEKFLDGAEIFFKGYGVIFPDAEELKVFRNYN